MTTLADMTPEQRAQCVGMWVDSTPPEWSDQSPGKAVGVLIGISGSQAVVVDPKFGIDEWVDLPSGYVDMDCIVPRGDLPRAWQPDGTPVDMDVETGIVRSHPRGGVVGSYESPEYVDQPEGTVMRRFVGEWEEE